ncbi:MAG TPA: fumarylacetoacetate hydrolase family protein [Verrucomicrobiae bacterium]
MYKLCRFLKDGKPAVGMYLDDAVGDLSSLGVSSLTDILEDPSRLKMSEGLNLPRTKISSTTILPPVERQEIWAAGVTYLRSKKARMEESDFSASAYDRVYEAPRPEIFFKSLAEKVSGPNGNIGIRADAKWNVPEPELALVINSKKQLVGFTAGNDMSSRDIEGENLLYLPQAKMYKHSCAIGPCIVLGASEEHARSWTITIHISREGKDVFNGKTSVDQIKRSFSELIDYLCRSQDFPYGAVFFTGTGIVPADDFTLQPGDRVRINISGIGSLENTVVVV